MRWTRCHVIGCPTEAIRMEPVSEEEWFHVPNSMAEWEEMRLQNLASTNRERSPGKGHTMIVDKNDPVACEFIQFSVAADFGETEDAIAKAAKK
jgi:hypothetical protein